MASDAVDQLIKDFLEARLRTSLDYFAIETRMSPDPNGDMGVTGSYRKHSSEKNVFFTATVNSTTHKIRNLQEY
jgi:hypothetical protein